MPDGEKYLGISVRKWAATDESFTDKIVEFADWFYDTFGIKTLFFPFKLSDDYEISLEISNKMKSDAYIIRKEYPANVIMGMISRCELVLGMRLHSLIYSTTVAVPVLGIVYDPKVKGFLQYINQNYNTDAENVDISYLKNTAEEIMKNKELVKNELEENVCRLKKLAMRNAEIAVEILEDTVKGK